MDHGGLTVEIYPRFDNDWFDSVVKSPKKRYVIAYSILRIRDGVLDWFFNWEKVK